jgi:hypothetical protein
VEYFASRLPAEAVTNRNRPSQNSTRQWVN